MHTALCAFEDQDRAAQAVDSLVRAGFDRHDVHIEHKHATAEGQGSTRGGLAGPPGDDRGVLSSFGHFFASLLGRDNPSGHVDTYAQHVERGAFVVVVDADGEAEAQRAHALLQELQGGDLGVLHRQGQQRLRDLVGHEDPPAGMVSRSREAYEAGAGSSAVERERAMASSAAPLGTRTGPELREPDLDHAPGLRYADKDKPL
ncbi:MAG TPA: hypothetical protein VNB23_08820 [Ramlibacter sp.]|nr:hypothetical protein [Ramlibacter sp.]